MQGLKLDKGKPIKQNKIIHLLNRKNVQYLNICVACGKKYMNIKGYQII